MTHHLTTALPNCELLQWKDCVDKEAAFESFIKVYSINLARGSVVVCSEIDVRQLLPFFYEFYGEKGIGFEETNGFLTHSYIDINGYHFIV